MNIDTHRASAPLPDASKPALNQNFDVPNKGLPPLELKDKPLAYFEFWPSWVFYAPVVVYWLMLAIRYRSFSVPMLANPRIDLGGMVGESKSAILDLATLDAKAAILPYVTAVKTRGYSEQGTNAQRVDELLSEASAKGINFPMIIKPDLGCRGAGVQKIHSRDDLQAYLDAFPYERVFMLQKLAPYQAEVGLFYQRMPIEKKGKVTSLTLKYAPYVIGDGRRTLSELISDDPRAGRLTRIYFPKNKVQLDRVPTLGEPVMLAFAGSHSRGSIFRDGKAHISPVLEDRIDELMQQIPDFHYGRMDLKFKDIESLERGEAFVIIEINGASSESTHIWDSRTPIKAVFFTLLRQYRTLFRMGDQVRQRGVPTPKISVLIKTWISEMKAVKSLPPSN